MYVCCGCDVRQLKALDILMAAPGVRVAKVVSLVHPDEGQKLARVRAEYPFAEH